MNCSYTHSLGRLSSSSFDSLKSSSRKAPPHTEAHPKAKLCLILLGSFGRQGGPTLDLFMSLLILLGMDGCYMP